MPAAGPAKKRASVKSAAKATAKPAAKPAAQAPSHAAATVVTKPAAKPATKPVKRSQQQASKAEREAKDKQEAQKALVTTAKDELLRFHKDAASKKAAAQQADSKKAAKSYAQAAEARKKNASKAEQELHNKKAQILLKTLRMAEARTPGKADNASQSKKQKVNGTGQGSSNASSKGSANAPGFDPTLCSCGENKVFCRDPLCFNLYCEHCGLDDDDQQGFESCGHGGSHDCYTQDPGPYCKKHIAKYLATCEECEVVACDTEPCDGCSSLICQGCLRDGMCEECRAGWADTRAEYGIESDEDSDNDPYGY